MNGGTECQGMVSRHLRCHSLCAISLGSAVRSVSAALPSGGAPSALHAAMAAAPLKACSDSSVYAAAIAAASAAPAAQWRLAAGLLSYLCPGADPRE